MAQTTEQKKSKIFNGQVADKKKAWCSKGNIGCFQHEVRKQAAENKMWQLESQISKSGEVKAKMAWKCTLEWNPFLSQFDLI